jgi:hypothetical protein
MATQSPSKKALSAVMAYLGSIKSKKKAAASRRNGLKNRKARK